MRSGSRRPSRAARTASWEATTRAIRADAYRRGAEGSARSVLRLAIVSPHMRFQLVLRLLQHVHVHHPRSVADVVLYRWHRRLTYRFGFEIPISVSVGPGLLLRHLGPIVVHQDASLGRNVNLTTGAIVGHAPRGPRAGVPTIGDDVYIGPGAKVIGAVRVGNDVVIGANAVVTKDVPDHSVVAGIPAVVISSDGSSGYVERRC